MSAVAQSHAHGLATHCGNFGVLIRRRVFARYYICGLVLGGISLAVLAHAICYFSLARICQNTRPSADNAEHVVFLVVYISACVRE